MTKREKDATLFVVAPFLQFWSTRAWKASTNSWMDLIVVLSCVRSISRDRIT